MVTTSGQPIRSKTTPIPVPRTRRVIDHRVLTSFLPGLSVPVLAIPLLREDQLETTRIRLNFEMLETVELLANAVNVRVLAHLVPFSCFERFQQSMDQFNRSYAKQPAVDGGMVTPFVVEKPWVDATATIMKTMGYHAREGQLFNSALIEVYNTIWNFRAKNRSPDLTLRTVQDMTLAKAFWQHQLFLGVVPDFDQAAIEGEVPLTVTNAVMPVKGIGYASGGVTFPNSNVSVKETGGATVVYDKATPFSAANPNQMFVDGEGTTATAIPAIYAELAENGITVSLANIELARKTQAFALLRKQYNGLSDEYLMDMLMNGIRIPDADMMRPILLADRSTVFGMNKRYATTADDLTASVVNGGTYIDLTLRTPRVNPGGVVMVCVEVTPEQLFERQADKFMLTTDQDMYPEFLRDTLDPQKVEIVKNEDVDVAHATGSATFGYRALNMGWGQIIQPKVGGKFYRPAADAAFDEDRQRIWAVETLNPTLSEDFYLCSAVHQKPFVNTTQDNFEVLARGMSTISGNTVFGRPLIEASDDYDQIMAEAPVDRIDPKTGTVVADAPSIETPETPVKK